MAALRYVRLVQHEDSQSFAAARSKLWGEADWQSYKTAIRCQHRASKQVRNALVETKNTGFKRESDLSRIGNGQRADAGAKDRERHQALPIERAVFRQHTLHIFQPRRRRHSAGSL